MDMEGEKEKELVSNRIAKKSLVHRSVTGCENLILSDDRACAGIGGNGHVQARVHASGGGDQSDQVSESDSELGTTQQRAGVGEMKIAVQEYSAAAVEGRNQF